MARAWRIESEGALYHVLSPGIERRALLFGDDERRFFGDTLLGAAHPEIPQEKLIRGVQKGGRVSPGRVLKRILIQ